MRGFLVVLKFELYNYIRKKSFIIRTIIISALMVLGLSLPNLIDMSSILPGLDKSETKVEEVEKEGIINFAIYDEKNIVPNKDVLKIYFPNSNWKVVENQDELNKLVENQEVEIGFDIKSPTEYSYVAKNTKFYDENKIIFDAILKRILVQDSVNNYLYAYILIFVVYIMILMYGQLIALSITSEKSNRSVEVLVTSTNTNNLIFGKVIAGAIASISQVGVIVSSALISYKLNSEAWNGMLDAVFKIPSKLIFTFAIFGILGYLFYSFIFGALGALVSKTEEIATSIGPVMMIFIVVFFISMFGLTHGDSELLKVCSYIPFASPMTMIARVATGAVTSMEFIISALILIISTVLAGICGSKIYRMATLMYGNPIKFKNALKWLKAEK